LLFLLKTIQQIGKTKKMATIKITADDGFFKTDKSGREVIQWEVSNHFPINVGDVVECEGRTVTIAAKGETFVARGSKTKLAYLYTEVPVRKPAQDDMLTLAAKYRAGEVIEEAQVVALVGRGLISDSEAMNRDW
jgi:hypothetical protein